MRQALRVTSLVMLLALVPSTGRAARAGSEHRSTQSSIGWPELGFDPENSSSNPYETLLDVGNVSNLEPKWIVPAGFVVGSPVISDGILYMTQDSNLVAVDAATGATLWVGPDTGASPAIAGGVVYTVGRTAYALDAVTGNRIWSRGLGTPSVEDLALSDGMVFTAADPTFQYDSLVALNAGDGSIIWRTSTGTAVGAPAVSHGLVYAGGDLRKVNALDARTGRHAWVGHSRNVLSPTTAVGNIVYVGTEGSVFALDGGSGETLWFGNGGGFVYTNLVVADGQVIASAADTGRLTASDALTGARNWVTVLDDHEGGYLAEANGVLYANTGFTVYAVEASTGVVLWSHGLGPFYTPSYPIVSDGVLYVGSNDKFYAFALP